MFYEESSAKTPSGLSRSRVNLRPSLSSFRLHLRKNVSGCGGRADIRRKDHIDDVVGTDAEADPPLLSESGYVPGAFTCHY